MALEPATGPMHAGAFEACADGDFATSFDDTGRSAESLGLKHRIAQAKAVVVDVLETFAGVLRMVRVAADGP